jgi:hypothetical protein
MPVRGAVATCANRWAIQLIPGLTPRGRVVLLGRDPQLSPDVPCEPVCR